MAEQFEAAGELQASASHPPPLCSPRLLGGPELPFAVRHNLTFAGTDALLDYLSLVFNLLGVIRFWPYIFPAARSWFALHFALPLANIAWRRRCTAACPASAGSWGRWRELLCAVVRITACLGCTWQLLLAQFEAEESGGSSRSLRSASLPVAALDFANSSGALVLFMLSFKPLRASYALPLQLAATIVCYARYAGSICAHLSVPPPSLRPLLHAVARGLDSTALVLPPFVSWHGRDTPSSTAECTSMAVFLQLCACLLPALHKAREEEQLYQQHQWQRAQRGLPPECGWDAHVYGAAADLLLPLGTRATLLWTGLLLLLVWHAAAALQGIGLV